METLLPRLGSLAETANRLRRMANIRPLSTMAVIALALMLQACTVIQEELKREDLPPREYNILLSPRAHGRVTWQGEPLSGVTIIRSIKYGDAYVDDAKTNANGEFKFPDRNITAPLPEGLFSKKTPITEEIYFKHNDSSFILWSAPLVDAAFRQELALRLLEMNCELSDERSSFYIPSAENGEYYTIESICRWPYGPNPNEKPEGW